MPDTAVAPAVAPAIAAPAPAPVLRNFNDVLKGVAANTGVADALVVPTPVVQIVRDAPKIPLAEVPAGEAPIVAEAPAVEAAPADAGAQPELAGEITLEEDGVTLRAERNADGTYKSKLDPTQKLDLEFKDKETGEVRKYTKTLPEILRLAKDGVSLMHTVNRLQPELAHYRDNLPKWKQGFKDLSQEVEDLRALNVELLTAPDEIVIQRRESFASENAPEKRLERENEELRRKAEQSDRERSNRELGARSQAFLESRGLSTIIKDAETKLGVERVAGKLAMASAPLLVNGVIPADRWPVLEQYIKGPFSQWLATEATKMETNERAAALARQATVEAQRKAQSVVNDANRNLVPVGRAAPDAPLELPKPKNPQDAINRMVHRPLPASVAASP